MIDDNYFARMYSELMGEQMNLMNELKNDSSEDVRKIQRQVAVITAILNQLSKWRELRKKKDE